MTKKFRIWDKLAQTFIYPDKGYQGHYFIDLNGRFHNFQNGSGGDEYIVQQWTGLTDSQGVEIYEGDIVFTIYPEYKIAKVFFCANSASFRLLSVNVALPMVTMRTQEGQPPKLINVFEKVIGNIFQNPELLEKC